MLRSGRVRGRDILQMTPTKGLIDLSWITKHPPTKNLRIRTKARTLLRFSGTVASLMRVTKSDRPLLSLASLLVGGICLSVSWKTSLRICTLRKRGLIRNALSQNRREKPWNSICTHIWTNGTALRPWSSNGLLLSSKASKPIKKKIMILPCSEKYWEMNAMKNSAAYSKQSKKLLSRCYAHLSKRNMLRRQSRPWVRCLKMFWWEKLTWKLGNGKE